MTKFEFSLIQYTVYIALWMYDDYVGLVFSLIMTAIIIALLIFSLVVEMIEKSKVPKAYYIWMLISIPPPIIVSLFFTFLKGGQFDWIDQFG